MTNTLELCCARVCVCVCRCRCSQRWRLLILLLFFFLHFFIESPEQRSSSSSNNNKCYSNTKYTLFNLLSFFLVSFCSSCLCLHITIAFYLFILFCCRLSRLAPCPAAQRSAATRQISFHVEFVLHMYVYIYVYILILSLLSLVCLVVLLLLFVVVVVVAFWLLLLFSCCRMH